MMFHTVVFSVTCQTGFGMQIPCCELVPVRPAIFDRVFLQYIKSWYVFMIGILCKAVEHFAVVPFSILLNKEKILQQVVFVGMFILIF